MKNWTIQETDANLLLMSEVLNISETMACVMANRGLRSKKTALSFLSPSIQKMGNILEMKDVPKTLERITKAIKNKEKIVVYGDYDVDGIMGIVILYKVLKHLEADVSYYIPHRVEEGYGMSIKSVEKLTDANLIITIDNGIAAIAEIQRATELGMDTIVIDHHEPGFSDETGSRVDILPTAVAIVDPKQSDCMYPFKELCAGGLAYKLAIALCEYMKKPFIHHDECLMLAALASICDIVPLVEENRIIVNCGLVLLNANKQLNKGIGALLGVRGYMDKLIDTFTIGFVIGPCLNATGRLESANLSVELLITEDSPTRMRLAHELTELNDMRKKLTSDCVERALATLPAEYPKVLVIADEEAHESVAGIVAGRIRESTNRPTILLTQGDGAMKGSGRSIEGYNLFESLYAYKHLFTRFGGHAMAAGLTLPPENISTLRDALNNDCTLTEADFRPMLRIDRELTIDDITLTLSDELSRLAPFGRDNKEPLFVTYRIFVESVRVIDEKKTLIFTFLQNSRKLKGIAFGLNDSYAQATEDANVEKTGGFYMDIVYAVETNVFNNSISVQVRIRDFVI